MNKKLIALITLITLIAPIKAIAAEPAPTIAILDTAIDTSLPEFKDKIVQEVCLIDWTTCPNGLSYMEGPGAASMPADLITKNGFDHGTQIASIFLKNNPNAKIVFIKIIGNTPTGGRQVALESTVFNALNWVKKNASKYNIRAVSMSQGHHNLGTAGTDYCPNTPITKQSVIDLASMQIPVFFPSGNGRDYNRIDWPACIDESVSVGYVDQQGEMSISSNNDAAKLDFFDYGFWQATSPGGVVKNVAGSSAAVAVSAAKYIQLQQAKPALNMNQLIDVLKQTSVNTIGRQGQFKKLISISAALSYQYVAVLTPQQIADAKAKADAAAKAALQLEINKLIADAELQYQLEVKAAADKLSAYKTAQLARLNG
jgi:hypothetical protein